MSTTRPGSVAGFAGAPLWIACAVLAVLAVASLAVGEVALSPARLWAAVVGRDELAATILWQIRLPRLLVAALVGAGLASSGLVMQAYFRNHLASPGLLGVSSGGAAGAVVAIAAGAASVSLWFVPLAAIAGAFLATAAVLGVAVACLAAPIAVTAWAWLGRRRSPPPAAA